MPLFGRKTKHAEDVHRARKTAAETKGSGSTDQNNVPDYTGRSGGLDSTQSTAFQMHGGQHPGGAAEHEITGIHGNPEEFTQRSDQSNVRGTDMSLPKAHNTGSNYQPGGSANQVGSAILREHGLRLEREAETLHQQSAEIAEAEYLEQEARDHRERAVASGADPLYRQPFTGPGGSKDQA